MVIAVMIYQGRLPLTYHDESPKDTTTTAVVDQNGVVVRTRQLYTRAKGREALRLKYPPYHSATRQPPNPQPTTKNQEPNHNPKSPSVPSPPTITTIETA